MLLLIYPLAETYAERLALEDAIGEVPPDLSRIQAEVSQKAKAFTDALQQRVVELHSDPALHQRFSELARMVVERAEVPLWLIDILQLWILYRDLPDGRKKFDVAVAGLSRDLELLYPVGMRSMDLNLPTQYRPLAQAEAAERIRDTVSQFMGSERSSKQEPRYTVMIRCPQTGKPFATQWTTDRVSWKTVELPKQRSRCPLCLGFHDWVKSDAYLKKAV